MVKSTVQQELDAHGGLVADMSGQQCAEFLRMSTEKSFELNALLDDLGLTPDMKLIILGRVGVIAAQDD